MALLDRLREELRRISPWKAVAIYAGSGYAVLEAADLFIERFGFPAWLFTGTLVLVLAGLPVLLITVLVERSRVRTDAGAERFQHAALHRRLFTWRNAGLAGIGAFALLGGASVVEKVRDSAAGDRLTWARTEATRLARFSTGPGLR